MTTREVYFKCLIQTDMPVGLVGYVCKEDGIVKIGKTISMRFNQHETNIVEMQKIEQREGFMFWNHSTEGEALFKKNKKELGAAFAKMVLNTK